MKFADCIIAWTPDVWTNERFASTCGKVRVGLKYPNTDFSERAYQRSIHGDKRLKGERAKLQVYLEFNTLVVRDRMDPQAVHNAFLAIDEYRDGLAPETVGSESTWLAV